MSSEAIIERLAAFALVVGRGADFKELALPSGFRPRPESWEADARVRQAADDLVALHIKGERRGLRPPGRWASG